MIHWTVHKWVVISISILKLSFLFWSSESEHQMNFFGLYCSIQPIARIPSNHRALFIGYHQTACQYVSPTARYSKGEFSWMNFCMAISQITLAHFEFADSNLCEKLLSQRVQQVAIVEPLG